MPSGTDALLRSIRRWLLAAVFLLGVAVVTLSHVGDSADYSAGIFYAVTGLAGGTVALTAGLRALGTVSRGEPGASATEEASDHSD